MYYIFWIYVLPRLGGYHIRQEIIPLDFGANTHRLVKVKDGDRAEWDETHDVKGNRVSFDADSNPGKSLEKGASELKV